MSRIRSKNTGPELVVRRLLYAAGMRYRLHDRCLPGTPDLVFPRFKAVIFVHGCFWHGHECPLFKVPTTRTTFWMSKISANRQRDHRVAEDLLQMEWRVMTIWECAIRGSLRRSSGDIISAITRFLHGRRRISSIAFRSNATH